jgi:hypothetical protein
VAQHDTGPPGEDEDEVSPYESLFAPVTSSGAATAAETGTSPDDAGEDAADSVDAEEDAAASHGDTYTTGSDIPAQPTIEELHSWFEPTPVEVFGAGPDAADAAQADDEAGDAAWGDSTHPPVPADEFAPSAEDKALGYRPEPVDPLDAARDESVPVPATTRAAGIAAGVGAGVGAALSRAGEAVGALVGRVEALRSRPQPGRRVARPTRDDASPASSTTRSTTSSTTDAAVDFIDEVPAFVEYRPTDVRRYALGTLFTVCAVLAVVAIFYAVQQGSASSIITAASVVVLAMASWWGLLSWSPTIVSITRGVLEVSQGPASKRADLRDPATEVQVGDNVGDRTWTARIVAPDSTRFLIRASQVRPEQFRQIVAHYRAQAGERRTTHSNA